MGRDKSKAPKGRKGNDDGSSDDSESEGQMDMQAYRSLLSKIFPSKHMAEKVKEMEEVDKGSRKGSGSPKNKKIAKAEGAKKVEGSKKGKASKPKLVAAPKGKGRGKKKTPETSSSESEEGTEEEDSSDCTGSEVESDHDLNQILHGKKNHKFNIIFTMGGPLSINQSILGDDDDEWETDESYDSDDDEYTEEEDDSSDDEWEGSESDSDSKEQNIETQQASEKPTPFQI